MFIKQYIKDFEKLGFGMFVHFGPYSALARGEWALKNCDDVNQTEYEKSAREFNPRVDWAGNLVAAAKSAGCKYITLTTRHHDGFSLFDTCGLSDYDAPHSCGRDLIREFADECKKQGIIPFFYHTLLDWHEKSYTEDFPKYLEYLRSSVEILCKNYGAVGGFWFDGMWDRDDVDWEEDKLYSLIRSYQPNAMIINNTGISAQGALGNIELDSVTFERGKPKPINLECSPKYIASEMCQTFCDHWGFTKKDLNYKSSVSLIEDLCICRRYRSNFLLNVGPMADGSLRKIDEGLLELIGEWLEIYGEAVYNPEPCDIEVCGNKKDFILKYGNTYYLFVHDLPMISDKNVALCGEYEYNLHFKLSEKIKSAVWIDNGVKVDFSENNGNVTVVPLPFVYGESLGVRIAKITV